MNVHAYIPYHICSVFFLISVISLFKNFLMLFHKKIVYFHSMLFIYYSFLVLCNSLINFFRVKIEIEIN